MAFLRRNRASGKAELVHPLKRHGAGDKVSMITHNDIADIHFRAITRAGGTCRGRNTKSLTARLRLQCICLRTLSLSVLGWLQISCT